ncbi:sacsin N-terminal ATP-binding-like domain-containing protein [Natrarchaeobaculum sulfurireducens]|uniref:ABC-type Na+ efflux pump, permease component n=1 Tax=Natrarchaeobaculum sulfurireducens TaxID=2044521 RepID=A0A346PJG0_9EURY|nr:DUF3883 domain-containing protein [Natrarchaeobaculum sulfurireducens]AXR79655.1 ABC-type Na+ efflux pump, permease component [Natrarchaeobaculum sulfurireducens]
MSGDVPSPQEWKEWIRDQRTDLKQEYKRRPPRLVSDYKREVSQLKGYSDRVLLELLQNADDAGIDASEPVRGLIRVTDAGIYVANTGDPFTKGGVESLLISDNSPKEFRNDSIGYKGLGFRSILNWGSDVLILSGELSLGFSDEFAVEFLEELQTESRDIERRVSEFEAAGTYPPIAKLSVPKWLNEGDIEPEALKQVYQEATEIQGEGYETVVGIPRGENDEVSAQLDNLVPETTLFLRNLSTLRIDRHGEVEKWSIDRGEDSVSIQIGNGKPERWTVLEDEGTIPEEYKSEGQTQDEYEIKVAFPSTDVPDAIVDADLFVFFPTEVNFPYPLLAHATFELDDSRNHLVTSDTNHYVAQKLAEVMADTAIELSERNGNSWSAFAAVSSIRDLDSQFKKLGSKDKETGFEDILRTEAADKAILPVHGNGYIAPNQATRIRGDFDGLLSYKQFIDVALSPPSDVIEKQLKLFGIPELEYEVFRDRLEEISEKLSVEERASIVRELLRYDLLQPEDPPELLIDTNEHVIPKEARVFLPPEDDTISLPDWVPQKILSQELTVALKNELSVTTNRKLIDELAPFSISEYNLGSLVQAIVAETNRRAKDSPNDEIEWSNKMVRALWELYRLPDDKPRIPEGASIRLPTRGGNSKRATELYLGEEYPNGSLLEALYAPLDDDSFVVSGDSLRIDAIPSQLESFLCWMGVNDKPKRIKTQPNREFRNYVLNQLDYPARFGRDVYFDSVKDANSRSGRYKLKDFETIDRLDRILEQADPHAILTLLSWVRSDLESWRREGDTSATFAFKPHRKRNWRYLKTQSIPSYPYWLIQNTEWVPVEGGEVMAPTQCSIDSEAKRYSPAIGFPSADLEHELFDEFDVDRHTFRSVLQDVGVVIDLAELSWDSLYSLLSALPEINPSDSRVKKLYSLILSKDGSPPNEHVDSFTRDGKVLAEHDGETSYHRIKNVRYSRTESLPEAIRDSYPELVVNTSFGSSKVADVLGVKTLSMDSVELTEIEPTEYPLNGRDKQEFKQLKQYVYGLRLDQQNESRDRATIKQLDIRICEAFQAKAIVDDTTIPIELKRGDFVLWNSVAYVLPMELNFAGPLLTNEDFAALVGDVFSSALDVNIRNEVYMLATAGDRERVFGILTGRDSTVLDDARRRMSSGPSDLGDITPPEINRRENSTLSGELSGDNPSPDRENRDEKEPQSAEDLTPTDVGSVRTERGSVELIESRTISVRQTPTPTGPPTREQSYRQADGPRAETLCTKFEEEQGRFPIPVGHIQGYDSYRCDIISFKTEAKRAQFCDESDPTLIDRYIEVKARSSKKGSITLSGNALRAAEEHRNRYFLYRAYESTADRDSYKVVVLKDPLGCNEATTRKVSVNPFKTAQSTEYDVSVIGDQEDESGAN